MTKKLETDIHRANGGNHSPVNYRKAMNMLTTHPYSNGRLYHIVFTHSEDRTVYRKAVELLCKELRARGMPCRYKACYELDKFKRFHKHVFILIEAKDCDPDTLIHFKEGDWFTEMTKELGIQFKIAEPTNEIHRVAGKQVNYAYVPKKAGVKLDNCLVWISYLTKVRSKAGVIGQIYTGSTNREPKRKEDSMLNSSTIDFKTPQSDSSKVLIASPTQHNKTPLKPANQALAVSHNKDKDVMLTSSQNYLCSIYEQCIDNDMDVESIRLHLINNGVPKSLTQIKFDLDVVYSFTGYFDSHPAPSKQSVDEFDKLVSQSGIRSRQRELASSSCINI